MLDFAILGILTDGPMHGYELKRVLADSEHGFWTVSFGSLYPALRRLEKQGFVSVGTGGGSRRKVYQLTPEGKAYFQEMLEEPGSTDEERAFTLKLAFFRYLDPDSRIGVLERRRAHLTSRLAESRKSMKDSANRTKRRMDDYTLALINRSMQSTEADIAWLDELIENERAARPPRKPRRARGTTPEPNEI
ncbi:MAG: PadR family transcriptional regulator [Acidimicrobiia bacterium]|nr:PadR family transcriptional regulator [Acidimicrobiia bacterium]MBT8215359.1 PadR family transcriptional regulator [Acidimicrobiia bacterium]